VQTNLGPLASASTLLPAGPARRTRLRRLQHPMRMLRSSAPCVAGPRRPPGPLHDQARLRGSAAPPRLRPAAAAPRARAARYWPGGTSAGGRGGMA